MSLPDHLLPKTPQVLGRVNEKQMAKQRGARLHPNSGAGRIKDDASNEETIFEFKSVKSTHTLNGKALLDLFKRAVGAGKEAEYVVEFEDAQLSAKITLTRIRKRR